MGPSPETVSSAAERLLEEARGSVVEVASGRRGAGAGVLWPGGFVLTADHVVPRHARRRRGPNVRVALRDGRTFDAGVARRDGALDLALLRLEGAPDDLPAATVGDSGGLRVGELVFALGHPWGRPGVATAGIVGGIGPLRGTDRASRREIAYVRSDLSLAPGNSGGPLLNAKGEVVGINAMIVDGFAFSIPSNTASEWVAGGAERNPRRLGVSGVPASPGGSEGGLVVAAVEEGSPADRAGLLVGDVLLGLEDGSAPLGRASSSLREALARAGDVLRLRVSRAGRVRTVVVRLGGIPESAA